jgi:hypothetical protein
MRHEVAHMGYKIGDVIGYTTFEDGRVASTWESTGNTWEDTYKVSKEDVNG